MYHQGNGGGECYRDDFFLNLIKSDSPLVYTTPLLHHPPTHFPPPAEQLSWGEGVY